MQYKDEALYVTANIFVSRNKLKKYISENSDWINKQKQTTVAEKQKNTTDTIPPETQSTKATETASGEQQLIRDIFAGRKTMVLGDIISVAPSMSSKTYLDGSTLYIAEKYFNDRDLRIKAIKSYLKKIAFLFVASEVAEFGSSVSLCPQKIEFKDVGDCWCKCSLAAQKNLCFDYRVTQLPQNLRFYLIAHAFAHFKFAAHDDVFWNYISNILPHYKDCEKQLELYDFLKEV